MITTIANILKSNKFFYVLISITGLWHIWSLMYSPLPWFDETFYVSITKAMLNGKGFLLEVCPIRTGDKEILTYGPVYFLLTGLSFLTFGFGIFQFRMVGLVFTALAIFTFSKLLTSIGVRKNIARIMTLLLAYDVIIIQSAHGGRMDMVALFFALVAWWAFFKRTNQIKYTLIMALAGVTAVLTTPRIAVLVFPLFIYALVQLLKSKNWLRASILTVLPMMVYSIWFVYAFGSITGFVEHFFTHPPGDTVPENTIISFIGGNLYVRLFQWPVILTAMASAIIMLVYQKEKQTILLPLLTVFTYYIIVKDSGPYSALIMPFWYLIIALGLTYNPPKKQLKTLLYAGVLISAMVNLGIFAVKATIVSGSPDRDPQPIEEWVVENLPENSKVVGDDRYYYACIKNNCDYQYIERGQDNVTRAAYHLNYYKPDYLFVSDETPKEIIEAYQAEFVFLEHLDYTPPKGNALITKMIQLVPLTLKSSYKGTLIRVASKEK